MKRATKVVFLNILLLVSLNFVCSAAENPLNAPPDIVKKKLSSTTTKKKSSKNPLVVILKSPVIFYREFMSPCTQDRCSHWPTCSQYSLLSFEKHGPIMGFIMTFDRLQHESNEALFSPLVKVDGVTRVFDPVENNDFWWYKE